MLRETAADAILASQLSTEAGVDPEDYFKLTAQLRRLLDRVAVPRRWSRDEVREVQKALKDCLQELDRQVASGAANDSRASSLRLARGALSMSASSVPTPAWYLCLLAAWEAITAEPAARRAN